MSAFREGRAHCDLTKKEKSDLKTLYVTSLQALHGWESTRIPFDAVEVIIHGFEGSGHGFGACVSFDLPRSRLAQGRIHVSIEGSQKQLPTLQFRNDHIES